MKIVFSIINSILVILAFLFFILIFQTENIENLALPVFMILLFTFNTLSIWRPINIWISIIQCLLTLIIIPILQLIFAISFPFVIALIKLNDPEFDIEQLSKVNWIVNSVSALIFLSAINIIYLTYQHRKKSNI